MSLEMFASNGFELAILGFFLFFGVMFLLFANKGEFLFAGVVSLCALCVLAYTNHAHYMGERFLMKQFHSGSALSCGMWKGQASLVDPSKGWQYHQDIGFYKGDLIINDPGVCAVIGKPFPEPSGVPYVMVLISIMGVLMMLRYALVRTGASEPADKEKEHADTVSE